MNENSERDAKIEKSTNEDKEGEMSSLTKVVFVVIFSLVFVLRMVSFNGSKWGMIGLILPVVIIFAVITQRK